MKKIAITYGAFDCLSTRHAHLITEMRKIVLPSNELIVIIPDDYTVFRTTGAFPIQNLELRKNNLLYLVNKLQISFSPKPYVLYNTIINDAASRGDKIVYVGYDDCKEFPGHELLRDAKIPLRFIKG